MEFQRSTTSFGVLPTRVGVQPFVVHQSTPCSATGRFINTTVCYDYMRTSPLKSNSEIAANTSHIEINSFEVSGEIIELERPIRASMTSDRGCFEIEIPELGIIEFGRTDSECLGNFMDALTFRWEEYAMENDSNLSPRALIVANNFRSMAKGFSCR